ncbi:ECF-type sigma factor [Lysobacter sp. CA199]|uniref:ECF-type sigma factor n=1 Tax=Lysobacter sp. CA199 TaxID=3455608 RepID=UPI003F8D7611
MSPETLAEPTPAVSIDSLFALTYQELRRLAHRQRCLRDGQTLNTTSLVHELYLQLHRGPQRFDRTRQFYAYAARAMRHLLIDRARERSRLKHGGDCRQVEFDDALLDGGAIDPRHLLELDQVLRQLSDHDPRAAEVVELHYFAGMPFGQIASLLERSERTVHRDWRYARAWLQARLSG